MLLIFSIETIHSLDLSEEEREWLAQEARLRFSEVNWEPLSNTFDETIYSGIIADYLKILTDSTGLKMDYVRSSTWQEVLEKFRNKEIEIIPAIAAEDDIGTEVLLTDPYLSFPLVIATQAGIDFINSTRELEGKRVGVGENYTSHNFLKQNYPGIELVPVRNVEEGLRLLNRGELYAFVGHMAVVVHNIKKTGYDLRIAGKTEFVFEHRLGLPPGHEKTVAIFNRVLSQITPQEHNRIYNRWIRINVDIADYSLIWRVLAFAAVIIAVFAYWNRRISKEKRHIQSLLNDLNTLKRTLEKKNTTLNRMATTDRLTGINNRFKLDEILKMEMACSLHTKHYFGIILLDIDHFKLINDTYGHLMGDQVLIQFTQLLKENVRNQDVLGRWGGEEFLIICPLTDKAGILNLAEKLRKIIESHIFPEVHSCNASFGCTVSNRNDDIIKLLKRADEALYEAKEAGRNTVVFFDREPKAAG